MKKIIAVVFYIFFFGVAIAQQKATDFSSSAILNDLKKLPVFGKVLYIAAHPDDENTRLLAWLANEKHYRTGYLSLTRGDGGQNLIGDEQGIELGLIRTQELLAARSIDGAEQFFTRAYDFGYSKSPDETIATWGHDKILSDIVWIIRKFQPDVIITRFPTTGEGGHGHHTASAILAGEAFDAASNPGMFPEQLKYGVTTWKPKRLLWNTFNFGGNNTTREDQLKIDVGGYNSVLGKSYGEIASQSRSQHKSQGFGVAAQRGETFEYFSLIKGDKPASGLMDAVDINNQFNNIKDYDKKVNNLVLQFNPYNAKASLPALTALYATVKKLPASYWKDIKLAELTSLIEATSGIFMEAVATSPYAAQGDSLRVQVSINNREDIAITEAQVKFKGVEITIPVTANKTNTQLIKYFLPKDASLSQPYWLELPMEKGSYNVKDQAAIGKAMDNLPAAQFKIKINAVDVLFEKPVLYKYTDPVKGELYESFAVVPQVSVHVSPDVMLSLNSNGRKDATTKQYRLFTDGKKLDADMEDYGSLSSLPAGGKYSAVINTGMPAGSDNVWVAKDNNNQDYFDLREIRYDHIPLIRYFHPASQKLVQADLKTAGSRVGYISGAGDKVPQALEQMGYTVIMLGENDITPGMLNQFDAVITGVRAYNTVPWLGNVYEQLMQYVHQGGVLLVQYNTNNNLGPLKSRIAPYPLTIGRTRITDENAKVNFIDPASTVLNYPNKITDKDFEGWVQERSIYQAEDIDSRYQKIFRMNDPNESPNEGSLVIADYGRGRFVYTGLVFFRELPAGIPGAYRLLANLIAKPAGNK